MRIVTFVIAAAVLLGAWGALGALDTEARKEIILKGREILAAGDFDKGVAYFDEQVKENAGDRLLLVWRAKAKQLAKLRDQAADTADPEKQTSAGRKLHQFYLRNGNTAFAESLDTKLFTQVPGSVTATMLAETLMVKGRNERALEVLESVEASDDDLDYWIQRGLALLRNGRSDDAKQVAKSLAGEEELSSEQARSLALLLGKTGFSKESNELLVALFESLEEDDLVETKASIKANEEWSFVMNDATYEPALNAKSKNQGCGSDCATCTNCF